MKIAKEISKTNILQLTPVVKTNRNTDIDASLELVTFDYAQIQVPNNQKLLILRIKEITHLVSSSNYCVIYLENGKSILTSKTLKYWEDQIGSKFFIRTHNSSLVNKFHITSVCISTSTITTTNNLSAPIARSRKSQVLSQI